MSARRSWMYESVPSSNMSVSAARSWRSFFLVSTARSQGAQDAVVQTLTSWGQRQVYDTQEADYVLCVCPIISRVGSDLSEAEHSVPGDLPCVLLVLHHTFQTDYICSQSAQMVHKPNIVLTVDLLFHQGALLQCPRNQDGWAELSRLLQGSRPSFLKKWKFVVFLTGLLCVAGTVLIILDLQKKI